MCCDCDVFEFLFLSLPPRELLPSLVLSSPSSGSRRSIMLTGGAVAIVRSGPDGMAISGMISLSIGATSAVAETCQTETEIIWINWTCSHSNGKKVKMS